MNDQIEYQEHTPSPLAKIKRFVTRVWEHPLLDKQTREHRTEAKTRLAEILEQFGVDPKSFVTIPLGSLIWATDILSDFDYQLVLRNSEDLDKISQLFAKSKTNGFQAVYTAKKINLVELVTGDELVKWADECVSLFFTPDEYLGGNIELARQLRLKAVTRMRDRNFSENDWILVVAHRFDIFFENGMIYHLNYLGDIKQVNQMPQEIGQ